MAFFRWKENCTAFHYLAGMSEAGLRFRKIRRRHKVLGLIRLFRIPNLLLLLLGQVLVVVRFSAETSGLKSLLNLPVLCLIFATQAAAAAGYIINDYHDVKIDLINKPSRVVIGRLVTRRKALFAYLMLNLLAIGLGFLAGQKIGLTVGLSCFLLWRYSARLKCIPLIGNLEVAFLVAISLYLPGLFFSGEWENHLYFCLFAFLSNLVRELVKDLEDLRGDRQHDCRTFAMSYGLKTSRQLINVCLLVLLVLLGFSWLNQSGIRQLLTILPAIPFGIFLVKLQKADRKMAFSRLSRLLKWAMLGGMLCLGL